MFKAITLTIIVALSACQLIVSFSGSPESGDQCKDTVDNDGNGVEDCKDPNCAAESFCIEAAVCGDNVKNGKEQCDDGNADELICTNMCTTAVASVCGNSVREGTEKCDDGNSNDNDECTRQCLAPPLVSLPMPISGTSSCSTQSDAQPLPAIDSTNVVFRGGKSPSRRVAVTPSGAAAVAMLCANRVLVARSQPGNPAFEEPVNVGFDGDVSDVEIAAGDQNTLYVAAVVAGRVELLVSTDGGKDWTRAFVLAQDDGAVVSDVVMALSTSGTIVVVGQGISANGLALFGVWSKPVQDPLSPVALTTVDSKTSPFDVVIGPMGNPYLLVGNVDLSQVHALSKPSFLFDQTLVQPQGVAPTLFAAASNDTQIIVANTGNQELYRYDMSPQLETIMPVKIPSQLAPAAAGSRRQIAMNDAGNAFVVTNQNPVIGSTQKAIIVQLVTNTIAFPIMISNDGAGPTIGMPAADAPNATAVIAWTVDTQVFAARLNIPRP
jgi:cysteine-rich repeat protein